MYGGHEYASTEYGGLGESALDLSPLSDSIEISEQLEFEVEAAIDSNDPGPQIRDRVFVQTANYGILINGIDRSLEIVFGSVRMREHVNQLVGTLSFSMRKYGTRDYTPKEGDIVEMYDPAGDLVFAGPLNIATKRLEGMGGIIMYDLEFVSWGAKFSARVVAERYSNETAEDIIQDLLEKYAPEFTGESLVDADFTVSSITFNRISLTEAMQKLAKLSNFSWYVDNTKDVHFFPRYANPAPFQITDTSANFIFDSLEASDNFSQIKNRVFVRGGEIPGNERSESYVADGDQIAFPLANKFSQKPTVVLNPGDSPGSGTPVNVGVDFLDDENSFDAFWSFQQKALRFKPDTKPDQGDVVDLSGTPLFRLLLMVEDAASISRLGGDPEGVREFIIVDSNIKTQQEARDRAQAEIEVYGSKIIEGIFQTNTPGLLPGQIIFINTPSREVAGEFIVQSISMSMLSRNTAEFTVQLATLRTMHILDILIDQVRTGARVIDDRDDEILERFYQQTENLGISELISRDVDSNTIENLSIAEAVERSVSSPVFVYAPYIPTGLDDEKVKARYNQSTYA